MFDSIDLKQAISDIYEAGLQDDKLSLIYQANKEIFMAVNTPTGLSERQTLENIVLQGTPLGPSSPLSVSRWTPLDRSLQPLGMVTSTWTVYQLEFWAWWTILLE